MNRKGFAITTVVYGLALLGIMVVTMLMGILSSTRNNISEESDRIENTLINYNLSSVTYKIKLDEHGNPVEQNFKTPDGEAGWYRIEAFGASYKTKGKAPEIPNYSDDPAIREQQKALYQEELEKYKTEKYGLGAYTTGIIYLNEGDILKINPGKEGDSAKSNTTVSIYDGTNSYLLMSAAGGKKALTGTNDGVPGGTLQSQDNEALGPDTDRESCQIINDDTYDLIGGKNINYNSGGGNISKIVGYPGCNEPKITISNGKHSEEYYFVDGLMLPSVHSGNGTVIIERIKEDEELYEMGISNSTSIDGTVETLDLPIKRIPRLNKKFNDVNKIIVTIEADAGNTIEKIIYTSGGIEETKTCNNNNCKIDFGTGVTKNIDDLTVTFTNKNVNLGGVRIRLLKNGVAETETSSLTDAQRQEILDSYVYESVSRKTGGRYDSGYYSTPTGLKLSAFQPDSLSELPKHGNYYIIPVSLENKVIAAASISIDDSSIIGAEYLAGEPRQKWSIDLLNVPDASLGEPNFVNILNESGMREYRIIDLARSKSLTVYRDENRNGGTISSSQNFNAISRNEPQIWNVKPLSDGTFGIKTVYNSIDPVIRSGYLYINTTENSDNENMLLIGNCDATKPADNDKDITPTQVERFRLYSLDFSTLIN